MMRSIVCVDVTCNSLSQSTNRRYINSWSGKHAISLSGRNEPQMLLAPAPTSYSRSWRQRASKEGSGPSIDPLRLI